MDESSCDDEEFSDVFLHHFFGTQDSPENIENPRQLNLRIFPDENFYTKMVRYEMLRKSKNVGSWPFGFFLIVLF